MANLIVSRGSFPAPELKQETVAAVLLKIAVNGCKVNETPDTFPVL